MKTYLESLKEQLQHYKALGEGTFRQLTDDQLFQQYNSESNSIGTLVKHLWGNMLSRFTDFLTSDGEKVWRKRDEEFENDINSRAEMLAKWEEGWHCLFQAVENLSEKDLEKIVRIRGKESTVVEALNRQLAHYAYHVGQIVFIGKMFCNEKWQSLSVPKKRHG